MRYFVGILAVVVTVLVLALAATKGQTEREQEREQELIESLVDADGEQKPSIFDTSDYGPAPSLEMLEPVSRHALEETEDRDRWELGDHLFSIVELEPDPSEARGDKQGHGLEGTGDVPAESSEPTYDAHAQPWETLPPARVAESSDDCVGYCFDAIVESVDRDDSGVARVVVFGEDGAPTRAVVERRSMTDQSRSATYYGIAVRFSCFEQTNAALVPRFEGCAQVAR